MIAREHSDNGRLGAVRRLCQIRAQLNTKAKRRKLLFTQLEFERV